MLNVNEIFYSIQGESIYAGLPCAFVRLTGCNLRCHYCDTQYAYDAGKETEMGVILEKVASFQCPVVEITGGEPLMQEETPILIEKFLDTGYRVLLETNGSFDIGKVDSRCIKIVDIKCPSSGEKEKNDLNNLGRLQPHDQVKFVIGNHEDYIYAKEITDSIGSVLPLDQILFSTVSDNMDPAILAKWLLDDKMNVRLHLQLHKILWPDIEKGV